MDDNLYIIGLIFIGGILIITGLSVFGGGVFGNFFAGGGSGLFASAFAAVETNWTSNVGQFLISFDNFANTHQTILDPSVPLKIFDVAGFNGKNTAWAATDHGLFLSRDGGLTWNRFISSDNEINASSLVFKVLPASNSGTDYFVSVFSNGGGSVYLTRDSFFHLQKLMDFDGEGAYDIYQSGNNLYFAMSTGQIISYNLDTQESRVANAFNSPVLKIFDPQDGYIYLLMKNGTLSRGSGLEGQFEKISIPSPWLFGTTPMKNVVFGQGVMYVLTSNGVYASYDSGTTFSLLKRIPIIKNQVDAIGANNGILYVISDHKLYISRDGGENWRIQDINNEFKAFQMFFVGQREIISM